jgi:hypothetical protein
VSGSVSEQIKNSKGFPHWVDAREFIMLREVAPGLFLGGEWSPTVGKWHAIVNLFGRLSKSDPRDPRTRVYDEVPWLLRWPIRDGVAIPPGVIDATMPFVYESMKYGPVLVHCQAGLSRSPSLVYVALMMAGLTDREAMMRITTPHGVQLGFPRSETLQSARDWFQAWSSEFAAPAH